MFAVTKYYYTGAQRIAMRTNGALKFLLGDHLGSTSLTTFANGNVVSEMRYKAWGEARYPVNERNPGPSDYTFTGQYSDSYINLLWYGSRHYDPELGRFIQPDSIVPTTTQGVQAYDHYAYTFNNPLRYVDPDGHDPILIALLFIATGSFILSACAPDIPTPNQVEIQGFIENQDYQGAINKAIELYDIDTNGVQPNYSPKLEDYGKTTTSGGSFVDGAYAGGTAQVEIGPNAFSSPEQLVDTLAHETFHVQQFVEDRWYESGEGIIFNEIEAYDHVLSLKDNLELSHSIIKEDEDIRNQYYKLLPASLKNRINQGNYTLPK